MKNSVMTQQTTTKKVKYKGVEDFVNVNTGEVIPMHVTDIEERDFNFSKVWMRNFIATLELVGNQKTKLCFWIIDHLNRENEITLNYRQIADATNISYQTVSITMKILQDVDFMRKVGTAYRVNPDIIFKGSRGARMAVLQDYHAAPQRKLSNDEKIAQLKESIKLMQEKINVLEAEEGIIDAEIDPQLSFNDDMEIIERARPISAKGNKR